MLKASAGGGGIGIQQVNDEQQMKKRYQQSDN